MFCILLDTLVITTTGKWSFIGRLFDDCTNREIQIYLFFAVTTVTIVTTPSRWGFRDYTTVTTTGTTEEKL